MNTDRRGCKTRGITFTGPSILALMTCAQCGVLSPGVCPECGSAEKLKSVTRRVSKIQPVPWMHGMWKWSSRRCGMPAECMGTLESFARDEAPYQPGDIVYAREALRQRVSPGITYGDRSVEYAADGVLYVERDLSPKLWQWKRNYLSSRFMPRWAARIRRDIVEVRAERLQDIPEEDAIAEGVRGEMQYRADGSGLKHAMYSPCPGCPLWYDTAREAFEHPWDLLHAKRHNGAFVWAENPVVFAYRLAVSTREEAEQHD